MLCFASGEIINLSNFSRSLGVSQPTVKKYIEIMEGTYMWRTLHSYEQSRNKSVVKMSRGHIRDTGLICHLLNIHSIDDLINNGDDIYMLSKNIVQVPANYL